MRRAFIFIISGLFALSADAQNAFIEGTVVYTVQIENSQPSAVPQKSAGTLTIHLKGNDVVKELNIEPGFKHTLIFRGNESAAFSLRTVGKDKYAVQLDAEQVKAKMQKCTQLTREDLPADSKTVGGFKTEKAKVHCNNAVPVILYFTREWQISNPYVFEEFPSFGFLPLFYDIKKEDGSLFHFELLSIEAKPIDNNVFKIPDGYKIISQEEYRSWRH